MTSSRNWTPYNGEILTQSVDISKTADGRDIVVTNYTTVDGKSAALDLSIVNISSLQYVKEGEVCNFTFLFMNQPGHILMNGEFVVDLTVDLSTYS